MNSVRFGEKLITPSKLLCIGRNYVAHINELNNTIPEQMVVFNKPNSCITSTLSSFHQERLHYEVEICFLIEKEQLSAVAIGFDLTKRDLQSELKSKGLPWERAKAFDGSAVFSRFIPLDGIDINQLQIELFINSMRVQCGQVSQMIYSPETILADLKSYTQLYDGDVIMTGTPQGVGEIHMGDIFLSRLKLDGKTLIEAEWVAR
ncbi:fumarylacetoacetate hydrolase family protein [Aliivibrio sp. S3MY1]|uniref:FAA hydrolase family protein n=1 Tax=Aliivibrio finisterrensis TaxID=511998 RepID=A0A4Q5KPR0_9GAMM|nr:MULTISPECIES: fumarylacetoacetate hydrolase family protein [Aliivibrio]MDD9173584.1 fumarylacetoacetate hydrolase family protein [Aliivibrio sp. S3TY1]MDD9190660.1 fumarylacetoacetate hydrolase family protein [Aliivibrio sp. S2TY2]MDD9194854.1 fumarylacetoacetate hydrolase family protein [Aliivibrio sp. S3MY1]MDD9198605.1 fumarylacetoacetate hydrolase family protein [Aliivibrio sp. S2MY1]RYU46895.1 FAA hydrolase family protein [Aliivibrio finisterrensis]